MKQVFGEAVTLDTILTDETIEPNEKHISEGSKIQQI